MEPTQEQKNLLDAAGLYGLVGSERLPHGIITDEYLRELMQIAQSIDTIQDGLKNAPMYQSPESARKQIGNFVEEFCKQFGLDELLASKVIADAKVASGV